MIKSIRRFIERGRKGYCTEDLWGFDNWLSDLITRGLKEFKKNCHSYPSSGVNWEEWMATLDEMIECFEEQTRSIENVLANFDGSFIEKWNKRRGHKKAKLHRGLELLERYYYDLWD